MVDRQAYVISPVSDNELKAWYYELADRQPHVMSKISYIKLFYYMNVLR